MLNHFFEFVLTYPNGRFLKEVIMWWFGFFSPVLTQIWSRRGNNKNSRVHSISFHKTKSTENAYITCLKEKLNLIIQKKNHWPTNQHLLAGEKQEEITIESYLHVFLASLIELQIRLIKLLWQWMKKQLHGHLHIPLQDFIAQYLYKKTHKCFLKN